MKKTLLILTIIIFASMFSSYIVNAQAWQTNDWILDGNYFYPYSLDYLIGIGTPTPQTRLSVFGGNVSILKNVSNGKGGFLFVDEDIRAKKICNSTGGNCKNLSLSWNDSFLDAADGSPTKALVVDNQGNISILGKLNAPSGTICDKNGCIKNNSNNWQDNPQEVYYENGKVRIGSSANASLNITQNMVGTGISNLLYLRPLTTFIESGGAIVFDTGSSSAQLQYIFKGANKGDFVFVTPNSGVPINALAIKSDGSVGIKTTNTTTTLDVNGSAKINGNLAATSLNVNGSIAANKEIDFVDGAKIITSAQDFIIRLP